MNDCVFSYICEGESCGNCKDYISMNCELGHQIREEYWHRVEEACKPVCAWLEGVRSGAEAVGE